MKDVQYKFVINDDDDTVKLDVCEYIDEEIDSKFKKIIIDDFEGEHKCPRCGFEWND